LFVTWSEETHAAPAALLDAVTPQGTERWVERRIAMDERDSGQMITMLVALFPELWRVLPHAPELDPETGLGWIDATVREVAKRNPHSRLKAKTVTG
jgi:hypothetical protein